MTVRNKVNYNILERFCRSQRSAFANENTKREKGKIDDEAEGDVTNEFLDVRFRKDS